MTTDYVRNLLSSIYEEGRRDVVKQCISLVLLENIPVNFDKGIVSTFSINYRGIVRINLAFIDLFQFSRDDLCCLLFHEILHKILGDTIELNLFVRQNRDDPYLGLKANCINIAQDIRINPLVIFILNDLGINTGIFNKLRDSSVLNKVEKEQKYRISRLLYPGYVLSSEEKESVSYVKLYEKYLEVNRAPTYRGYHDIYELLYSFLTEENEKGIEALRQAISQVLGDHLGQDDLDEGQEGISKQLKEETLKVILKTARKGGEGSKAALSIIQLAEKENRSIDFSHYKSIAFSSSFNNIRLGNRIETIVSRKSINIPQKLSRKDIFLISQKIYPTMWDRRSKKMQDSDRLLPIYLDISSSMNSSLPNVVKLLVNLKSTLKYIWGFSTEVHKHSLEDLKAGKLTSTGGTSAKCILDHSIQQKYTHILVITDGDFYDKEPLEKPKQLKEVITLITGEYCKEHNFFTENYTKAKNLNKIVK